MAKRFRYKTRYVSAPRRRSRSFRLSRRFGRRKNHKLAVIPLVTALAPAMKSYMYMGGNIQAIMNEPYKFATNLVDNYTGYDIQNSRFDSGKLINNIAMWAAGYGAHYLLNRVGVNKSISKIPLLGKYVSL